MKSRVYIGSLLLLCALLALPCAEAAVCKHTKTRLQVSEELFEVPEPFSSRAHRTGTQTVAVVCSACGEVLDSQQDATVSGHTFIWGGEDHNECRDCHYMQTEPENTQRIMNYIAMEEALQTEDAHLTLTGVCDYLSGEKLRDQVAVMMECAGYYYNHTLTEHQHELVENLTQSELNQTAALLTRSDIDYYNKPRVVISFSITGDGKVTRLYFYEAYDWQLLYSVEMYGEEKFLIANRECMTRLGPGMEFDEDSMLEDRGVYMTVGKTYSTHGSLWHMLTDGTFVFDYNVNDYDVTEHDVPEWDEWESE